MTEIHAFDPDGTPSPGAEMGVGAIMTTTLDPQVASWLHDATTETHEALNVAVGERTPGIIDALQPPPGLAPLVADADFYDPGAFKYFTDPAFETPSTDNTPALQAMVDHLYSNGGGVIVLPRGNFVFRGEVIWRSRVSLRGASKTSTRLYSEGVIFSLITHASGFAADGSSADDPNLEWHEDCSFTDFLIDNRGLSHPNVSVGGKGIFLLYMKRAVFRDLVLLNTIGTALGCDFLVDTVIDAVTARNAGRNSAGGSGGNSGIGIGTAAEAKEPLVVSNCFTYDCGNYGIFVETQKDARHKSLHAKIVNCHAEGNYLGFGNKGSGGTLFLGCTAVDNVKNGFHLSQGSSGDRIIGCTASGNGDSGIITYSPYVGDLMIASTVVRGNARFGIELNRNGVTYPLRNVTITGCEIAENSGSAIYLHAGAGGRHITIASNLVFENSKNPTGLTKGTRGIYIGKGSDSVTVSGNTISDPQVPKTQTVGMEIDAAVTGTVITGNNAPGYEDANAFQFPKSAKFQGNSVTAEKSGTVTLPAGTAAIYVNHFLGALPAKIAITPLGDARVWVSANETNRMRVQRDDTTAALDVMWAVS